MSLPELHEKITAFEESLGPGPRELSQCKKGCSQCCEVKLSVFSVEADFIREWWKKLPEETQKNLRDIWKTQPGEEGKCDFLVNHDCTIYEARPVICRSQGLPLRFKDEGQLYLDICPLNDEVLLKVPSEKALNLDLLNAILAGLQGVNSFSRVSLSELRAELSG